jgi:outer membrane protein
MRLSVIFPTVPVFCLCLLATFFLGLSGGAHSAEADLQTGDYTSTLEECLQQALENNRRRPASRYAVAIAEAQHRQALAGYWPQIAAKGGYQLMDETTNFLFPARSFAVPAQTLPLPPGLGVAIVDPANNVVGSISSFPGQTVNVPEQDIKLMDEESYFASVEATWLLYDGGMRKGYREQTKGLVDMMKQDSRRTDLEIVDSVKRFYYGAVLAIQIHQIGKDTLARMGATLNLTET